jgi:hypothetical protein
MAELSPEARLQSRNFETEALRRVAEVQLDAIAVALGCDKSTVSRMFNDRGIKLSEIPLLLSALGWKVVSKEQHCVPREEYEALRVLAAKDFRPHQLEWGND